MSFLASMVAAAGVLALVPQYSLENTNIFGFDEDSRFVDYNRLRADISVKHEKYEAFAAKLTIDNEAAYIERPYSLTNDTSIYRGYLEYHGETHFWVIGRQRIPLGVGRVWNPIDIFNPIDSQSVEPQERPGTEALRYEYAVSQLANFDCTLSRDKGEARLKGYLDYADVALVGLYDNDADLDIIGWELEGELFASGIELRSEGGSFHDDATGSRHTEFIAGAEYGFVNSLTVLGEYRYSDETKSDDMAISLSFQPEILWTVTCLGVENLNDHSFFIAPSVEYSTGNESTLSAGAFLYHGSDRDVYGGYADRIYVRWFVHF
ncbi:MAG: hypothetical protein KKC76_17855 [Proteobacteria bacterium]|nr:hypothetical protein [Pseudomonadota bacterium]MBU4297307.1 hypothetical protein [Pseudomonadota bacterium]MCG2747741.1 hypothetical protein [Desulfobulbaceae bacterium]